MIFPIKNFFIRLLDGGGNSDKVNFIISELVFVTTLAKTTFIFLRGMFMKNRLHDKKAGIAILVSLILISVAEVILRGVILNEALFKLSNAGEPCITVLLSLVLIIFATMGKDRIFYIICGGWLGFFVFKQLFDLPSMLSTFYFAMQSSDGFTDFAILIHVLIN